jgi:hypothetical protein
LNEVHKLLNERQSSNATEIASLKTAYARLTVENNALKAEIIALRAETAHLKADQATLLEKTSTAEDQLTVLSASAAAVPSTPRNVAPSYRDIAAKNIPSLIGAMKREQEEQAKRLKSIVLRINGDSVITKSEATAAQDTSAWLSTHGIPLEQTDGLTVKTITRLPSPTPPTPQLPLPPTRKAGDLCSSSTSLKSPIDGLLSQQSRKAYVRTQHG